MDGLKVTVDDQPLDPRFDLKVISRDGFEWSYEGEAPAQLALALLAEHLGDERALQRYEPFMRGVVANFNNEWEMSGEDIDNALEGLGIAAA